MNKSNTVGVVPLVFERDRSGPVVDSVISETDRMVRISREHIQQMQDSRIQNEKFIAESVRQMNTKEESSSD